MYLLPGAFRTLKKGCANIWFEHGKTTDGPGGGGRSIILIHKMRNSYEKSNLFGLDLCLYDDGKLICFCREFEPV